mmetsp:Transcript_11882/g.49644  ORF Transcript_11882/g.49644 Transcript_11882/m.49644 type:complete len:87 (+) Transcript_11882:1369-1629(+)
MAHHRASVGSPLIDRLEVSQNRSIYGFFGSDRKLGTVTRGRSGGWLRVRNLHVDTLQLAAAVDSSGLAFDVHGSSGELSIRAELTF